MTWLSRLVVLGAAGRAATTVTAARSATPKPCGGPPRLAPRFRSIVRACASAPG